MGAPSRGRVERAVLENRVTRSTLGYLKAG
jgi:hypothetical protein